MAEAGLLGGEEGVEELAVGGGEGGGRGVWGRGRSEGGFDEFGVEGVEVVEKGDQVGGG